MIIMIVINISVWGSPNVHYLDMGVTFQKGWETLTYRYERFGRDTDARLTCLHCMIWNFTDKNLRK